MPDLTIDDLSRILRECAGEDEAAGSGNAFADTTFTNLGYDSLAVMEAAACLKREYGVRLTDEEVLDIGTPRELLELARRQIAAAP